MSIRGTLALLAGLAASGSMAQGYLGATDRVEFICGGSVFPNIVLLFDGANDYELAAGYFHCLSPQWEVGLTAGKGSLDLPLRSTVPEVSSDERIELGGLMVRAESRFYLRSMSHSTAPMGYYLRPAFQYQALKSEVDIQVDANTGSGPDSLVTRSFNSEGSTMILGFGFGRQTFFGEHISLDWTLTTGCAVSTTVDDTFDKKAVSKELFRTQIFGVRFGVGYQF